MHKLWKEAKINKEMYQFLNVVVTVKVLLKNYRHGSMLLLSSRLQHRKTCRAACACTWRIPYSVRKVNEFFPGKKKGEKAEFLLIRVKIQLPSLNSLLLCVQDKNKLNCGVLFLLKHKKILCNAFYNSQYNIWNLFWWSIKCSPQFFAISFSFSFCLLFPHQQCVR